MRIPPLHEMTYRLQQGDLFKGELDPETKFNEWQAKDFRLFLIKDDL